MRERDRRYVPGETLHVADQIVVWREGAAAVRVIYGPATLTVIRHRPDRGDEYEVLGDGSVYLTGSMWLHRCAEVIA